MIRDSNTPGDSDQRTGAYAWRPAAILFLALAGLICLLESDTVRAAIEAVLGSPLR